MVELLLHIVFCILRLLVAVWLYLITRYSWRLSWQQAAR
jgi:hypothetical protein